MSLKKLFFILFISGTFTMSAENVLLKEFRTTNGAIPFDKIAKSDFEPAIDFAIKDHITFDFVLDFLKTVRPSNTDTESHILTYSGKYF